MAAFPNNLELVELQIVHIDQIVTQPITYMVRPLPAIQFITIMIQRGDKFDKNKDDIQKHIIL